MKSVDEAILNGADWPDIDAWRKERRAELRARRVALPPLERRALQERIHAHLEAGFPELSGAPVGFSWPIRGEVNGVPFMRRHVAAGGLAALPVIVARKQPVEWWQWTPTTRMRAGIWRIPVPVERHIVSPAILLVPLVGFDERCYRLGNGGGYYDRTLAVMQPRPLALGVGYELGRLETIQPQPHDIPLDAIVTEAGVHWPPADGPAGLGNGAPGNSSPVCYADAAPPEYFGFLSRAETLALLNTLLQAKRAGVRVAGACAAEHTGETAAALAALQRDEARCCGLLARLIRHLQGETGRAPGDFRAGDFHAEALAATGAMERLRFLAAGQGWVVRELREALPRIRDEAVHAGLQELLALHERNGARADALIAGLG